MIGALPRVAQAEHRGGFRIRLTFSDGVTGTVDCRRWLRHGAVFEPLNDPTYFSKFFLDGESVEWPNGASIAPETLYAAVRGEGKPAASKRNAAPKRAGRKRKSR